MEYEKCYVFQSAGAGLAKRRKIEPQGLQASWKTRRQAYEKAWAKQEEAINEKLDATNETTTTQLDDFLNNSAHEHQTGRIPTAVISAGPDPASQHSIVQQLQRRTGESRRRVFVSVSAASATNLKAALKGVIQRATQQAGDVDDEDEVQAHGKGRKLLNYDLQILCDYVRERRLDQVVLSIEDTEAFNSDILSELIEILGCWHDRIPFVFLLSIATSLDFLQQRLSRGAVRCLDGQMFDVAPAAEEINRVFEAITGPRLSLCCGPNLLGNLLERQSDYVHGIDSLSNAVQYAYMSCYFANALSIFLDAETSTNIPRDHFEAARSTPSFRAYCRSLLDNGNAKSVRELLDSDAGLFDLVFAKIVDGRESVESIKRAAMFIKSSLSILKSQSDTSISKLYLQAMSGKLQDSALLRSMLLSIRKAPSDIFTKLLQNFAATAPSDDIHGRVVSLREEFGDLLQHEDLKKPLRSEDDVKHSTLRTTVVAQKVELSKQKSSLSKEDATYTAILRRFTDLLEEYLESVLINPKELVFHEIFLYDLKSPHREIFTPRPRHAIERALAAPHDYLDCECCAPGQDGEGEATLSATQPATAILYQLYLESASLINASDLWQAFQAVSGDEKADDETMALFQRALAELQYLGMVKSTRKRVDHIAKTAWRGL